MQEFPANEGQPEKITLTPAEKARVAQRARRTVGLVILSQAIAGLLMSLVLWVFGNQALALSALLGCLTYWAPNALFAARLALSTYKVSGAGPVVFFIGQSIKIFVAIGLLWGLSQIGLTWLSWPAVIAGLIATLKGYWLMVLFTGGRIAKYM